MWTNENRGRYDRRKLRYLSDLTDEEWLLVKPLIPAAKRGGNKRTVDVRAVVNGLMLHSQHGMPVGGNPEGSAAAQPCTTISAVGIMTARLAASIMHYTSSVESWPSVMRARLPRS